MKASNRIVGGKKAKKSIPWQVSVRSCNSGQCHFCGGTVLDKWTILSAAHCFTSGTSGVSIMAGNKNRMKAKKTAQVNLEKP